MTGMLVSVAEVSNIFSVLTVLLALFVMVICIFRLQMDDVVQPTVLSRPPVPALSLEMVHNPFVLKIPRSSDCTLEGVTCVASSQVPWMFQAFWGVLVEDFSQILHSDWNVFKELLLSGGLLIGSCLQKGELQHFPKCSDMVIDLAPRYKLCEEDLGITPRTKYPLVLLMVRDSDVDVESNEVVTMANVIHIKDTVCETESCIFMQYLKKSSGQTSCLKPLYVASDDITPETNPESNADTVKESSESQNLCVVCQTDPITRALLPCRHTCVCNECFKKIDKCPMCRSSISTYFCIREETEPQDQNQEAPNENVTRRVERYMGRLNSFFGFS